MIFNSFSSSHPTSVSLLGTLNAWNLFQVAFFSVLDSRFFPCVMSFFNSSFTPQISRIQSSRALITLSNVLCIEVLWVSFSWRPAGHGQSLDQASQHQICQDQKSLDLRVNALDIDQFLRKLHLYFQSKDVFILMMKYPMVFFNQ